MARRKKDRGAKRRKRRLLKLGFTNAASDNPFANTRVMQNANEETVLRMQRRYNSDQRRRNTFAQNPNIGITKGYDTVTSILSSAIYMQLKESTTLDSYQIIELIKAFDENIPPEVLEHALITYMNELTLPTVVSVESIQEALDAGFEIDEAIEYAELMAQDVQTEVSAESAFTDIYSIAQDIMAEIERNGTI